MAYFVYQPHVRYPEKTTTPDLLLTGGRVFGPDLKQEGELGPQTIEAQHFLRRMAGRTWLPAVACIPATYGALVAPALISMLNGIPVAANVSRNAARASQLAMSTTRTDNESSLSLSDMLQQQEVSSPLSPGRMDISFHVIGPAQGENRIDVCIGTLHDGKTIETAFHIGTCDV